LVANALCAIHGCESVKALLTKAAAVPEVHRARKEAPQPLKIAAASDEDIAGAQKAMLEFLGLHKAMLTPEILAHQSDISSPAGGTVSRTLLLPGRVAEAYRVQYDKEIPAEVRWHSFEELRAQGRAPSEAQRQALQEFTEQGLRLAALDMDLLRAGISQLLKEKGWSQNFMEAKGGIKGHMVSLFLNGRRRSTLSTIADMSKALGVADIFTLEEMGKAAMERVTSPQGQGANKRGKLLPEPQDAKERAGGHFTTAALRRMLDRGAFDKNRSK
jgi:transcriptional regulator with XRE-family HTH domain